MEKELKELLESTLIKHEKIEFEVIPLGKDCRVDIKIGEIKNEEYGPIYDMLSYWLSYGQIVDYILSHSIFYNYSGEIILEGEEIYIYITLYWINDFFEEILPNNFYLEEEFIKNGLEIDLKKYDLNSLFNQDSFNLRFELSSNRPIENIELSYYNGSDWIIIDLEFNQLQILEEHITTEIKNVLNKEFISNLDVDFDFVLNWNVTCEENYLDFNFWTSPIKISLNEIESYKN